MICTKESPYQRDSPEAWSEPWQHPDAVEIKERDIDYSVYVTYKCPHCGLEFEIELPD